MLKKKEKNNSIPLQTVSQKDFLFFEDEWLNQTVKNIFSKDLREKCYAKAVKVLDLCFGEISGLYELEKSLILNLDKTDTLLLNNSGLKAYLSLDCFNNKIKRISPKGFWKKKKWQTYFQKRAVENMELFFSEYLVCAAVKDFLPEPLIPDKVFSKILKRKFKLFPDINIKLLDLMINFPVAGGEKWLFEKTERELNIVKENLNNNIPVVACIIENKLPSANYKQMIACKVVEQNETLTEIIMIDPETKNEVTLQIDKNLKKLIIKETEDEADAFFCIDYSPEKPPKGFFDPLFKKNSTR
ncbi:MAG: hypothetical protein ACEPO8_14915 [Rhodothermaceae bacterium]